MRMRALLCLLLSLFLHYSVRSQDAAQVAVGQWRVHLPSLNGISLAESEDGIYLGTEEMLLYYERNTGEMERITRIEGLSDLGISCIKYASAYKLLVVAYENGNVDLVDDRQMKRKITNLNALKLRNMTGQKRINKIHIRGKIAYLATAFGILELDLERKEFRNTMLIGTGGSRLNVWSLDDDGQRLYAATDSGILSAPFAAANMSDFNNWTRFELFGKERRFEVAFWNNELITTFKDSLIVARNGQRVGFGFNEGGNDFYALQVHNGRLSAVNYYRGFVFDTLFQSPLKTPGGMGVENLKACFEDRFGVVWLADEGEGLVRFNGFTPRYFRLTGPKTAKVFELRAGQGQIQAVAGGVNDAWNNAFLPPLLSFFKKGEWKTLGRHNVSGLGGTFDLLCSRASGRSGRMLAGSWNTGLFEFDDDGITRRWWPQNSPLEYQAGSIDPATGIGLCRISAMDYYQNELYVVNYGAENPIAIMSPDSTWRKVRTGTLNEYIGLTIDSRGQKWLRNRLSNVVVLNKANNDYRVLTNQPGLGGLPDAAVNCVTEDLEGQVWVGTNKGPAVFFNPGNIFSGGNYDARQIKIQQGLFVGFLLGNEVINCIAVDGANRKWFGTNNGAWLMSADGQNQIRYFNSENSPLLSNNVLSIAVDPESGEVFFGTDRGIISFRSDATAGGSANNQVLAFPNPYDDRHSGPIVIRGLVRDALVKVTDVNGTLVYQGKANGGSFSWNVTDPSGEKVRSGVYLVFSMNAQGEETLATKILVVR